MSKNREMFENLLRQIELAEKEQQHPMIQESEIKEVVVHEKSRVWEFLFKHRKYYRQNYFMRFIKSYNLPFNLLQR